MLQVTIGQLMGAEPDEINPDKTFLELGAESLLLMQASQAIQDRFGVKVPFRALLEELTTTNILADHLEQALGTIEVPPASLVVEPTPDSGLPIEPAQEIALCVEQMPDASPSLQQLDSKALGTSSAGLERIMTQQMQIMAQQLDLLRNMRLRKTSPTLPLAREQAAPPQRDEIVPIASGVPVEDGARKPATCQQEEVAPYEPIQKGSRGRLSDRQQRHLETLIARLAQRTRGSKQYAQDYRPYLADSQAVAGFRSLWKELCYPIVAERGAGGRIWDVDGNEYVDLAMGFGSLLFGHSPSFVTEALQREVSLGARLGPQSYQAGEVAKLLCELTGTERAVFCNSGTEAVMTALRMARAVTGRTRIALFPGSYHGTFDQTLVHAQEGADGRLQTLPMALGVAPNLIKDVVMLHYAHPESIEILEAEGPDLAAVMLELPRSRRPDRYSDEFARELRRVTQATGTTLIFDEIVTGFRTHLGGMQALLGIQADIVTYGKAVGGGMPIGVAAGKARYLDAIDGGMWQYGDDSYPQADTTLYTGTFCKHPLAMAAAWAVLNHLKEHSPRLQERLNERMAQLAATLNTYFEAAQVPIHVAHFASWFRFEFSSQVQLADLFYFHLLDNGVHVPDTRTCSLCTAHTEDDLAHIVQAVKESVDEMRAGGFLPLSGATPFTDGEKPAGSPFRARRVLPTEAHRQFWTVVQMGKDASIAYNQSITLKLRGQFRLEAMQQALQTVVDRHESLRMTFEPDGSCLNIAPSLTLSVPLIDFTNIDQAKRKAQVTERITREVRRPFDLVQGPLLRTLVLKQEKDSHLLVLTFHHLIMDGQSVGRLLREIKLLYSSACAGTLTQLPSPTPFSEYVQWQREQQEGAKLLASEAYWLKRFAGPLPVLELPTDRPHPSFQTHTGARQCLTISASTRAALAQLSAQRGATMYATLLASFTTLLHRLAGQDDVVVGISVAGQSSIDSEHLVGYCITLLPLRAQASGDPLFVDYLDAVKRDLWDAYEHQGYSLSRLIKALNPPRDPSRPPLVTVAFNLDFSASDPGFPDLETEVVKNPGHSVQFEIDLNVVDKGDHLVVEWDYNTDLFDDQTITRWLGHYRTLLDSIAAQPQRRLSELPLLTTAERQQMLFEWNHAQAEYAVDRATHELFEAQVEKTPQAIAVVFDPQNGSSRDEQLTYQELNWRANQLAHHLRALGVRPDTLVGIYMERSLEMMVALLGIFKAGGAYVPLDPAYPRERVAFMLADTQVPVLLTHKRLLTDLPDHQARVICIDADWETIARESTDNLSSGATGHHLAYVAYTSGSTGKPKGVMNTHRGHVNYLLWDTETYDVQAGIGALVQSSFAFDFTNTTLFPPLFVGRRVIFLPEAVGTEALSQALRDYTGLSLVKVTPAHLNMLNQQLSAEEIVGRTNTLVVAADQLLAENVAFLQAFTSEINVFNEYGPTETVAGCSAYRLSDQKLSGPVPIGCPIPNIQFYVLDAHLQPVPIGIPGELCIGGVGVARGYLNHPDKTAECFIPDPFSGEAGARMYKTGDVVRYLPDGNVEFLSRVDNQVKVRGYRVELGEIEATLSEHAAVREMAVLAREESPGQRRLVAYVVVDQQLAPSVTELRRFVQDRLPEYMIPSAFVFLDALPLSPNGKVNTQALPVPDRARPELEQGFVAPLTPAEKTLAEIWGQVIDIEQVGIHDNFFELGGDSILAIQIVARAKAAGLHLTIRQVFQHQTIAELATMADAARTPQTDQDPVIGPVPFTPIQNWFFEQNLPEPHHFNQAQLLQTRQNLDAASLEQAAQYLLTYHDALRLRFSHTPSGWQQMNAAPDELDFSIIHLDLSTVSETEQAAAISAQAAILQASLNLSAGPLIQVALFDLGPNKPNRLLLVAHHLAVDITSWQILLEDLRTVYQQLVRGEAPQLSPKTTAYKQWAEQLTSYAQSSELGQELDHWLAQASASAAHLPYDYPEGVNTVDSVCHVSSSLNAVQTRALQQDVPLAYRTLTSEVLLTALVQAFSQWTGVRALQIDLEGNGRAAMLSDANLSRTVGWFTTLFPVLLELDAILEPGTALKTIKEQLRTISQEGIDYGLLRYLSADEEIAAQLRALPQSEVSFLYLGQAHTSEQAPGLFAPADESCGPLHSQQGVRRYAIDIQASIVEKELHIIWTYSKALHRRTTIEKLAQSFVQILHSLIAHCQSSQAGGLTPSDFPEAGLSQEELDQLYAQFDGPLE